MREPAALARIPLFALRAPRSLCQGNTSRQGHIGERERHLEVGGALAVQNEPGRRPLAGLRPKYQGNVLPHDAVVDLQAALGDVHQLVALALGIDQRGQVVISARGDAIDHDIAATADLNLDLLEADADAAEWIIPSRNV